MKKYVRSEIVEAFKWDGVVTVEFAQKYGKFFSHNPFNSKIIDIKNGSASKGDWLIIHGDHIEALDQYEFSVRYKEHEFVEILL
jgi:hypothetical protein